MKNQILILTVALGLFVALNLPARGDVLATGSIFTNFNFYQNTDIIVGNDSDGASLIVDGGSIFSTVPDGISGPVGFGVVIGVECFATGYPTGQYSSLDSVTGTGVGSQIGGGVSIGSGTNGGPNDSLIVSDGGGMIANEPNGVLGIGLSGTSNSILVTGVGSYLAGGPPDGWIDMTISGYGNTFEVLDGAVGLNGDGELSCLGSNCSLVIGGTNTTWTGAETIFLFGSNDSLAITNGASVSAYTIASGEGTESNSFLIDGVGTTLNGDEISLSFLENDYTKKAARVVCNPLNL